MQVALDADQQARLARFVALLARWNRTYNLTAVDEPEAMVDLHIADSLAAVAPLRRELASVLPADGERRRLLDVGSGGGLPGFVLAVAEPRWQLTCVDSVGKKAAFITQAAAELAQPNVAAMHARVESMQAPPAYDAIVSRAFASLDRFVDASRHLIRPGGVWMAMKSRTVAEERRSLPDDVELFHVEPCSVPGVKGARALAWMRSKQTHL